MSFIERREVRYALGTLGVAALAYGLYKTYRYFFTVPPKIENETKETPPVDLESQTSEEDHDLHIPYPQLVGDLNNNQFNSGILHHMPNIREINYKIILTLIKGSGYQGIVNLSFSLDTLKGKDSLDLNFRGTGLKYLKVNSKILEAKEVMYHNHKISIPNYYLKEKSKNTIEIIFENDYSFLGNGMAAYFVIDDHNKYSLRQQVIYSIAGWNQVEHIIPCLNCTNQCTVRLEIIHPDTFEVFSNSIKQLKRLCSINDYQSYPFLFDHNNSLNKNLKVNSASSLSLNGSAVLNGSKVSDTMSNYTSSTKYNGRKRANTHFHLTRLPSIHNFFVFCSAITELQHSPTGSPIEEEVLLRYFCKYSESHLFHHSVVHIHNYIIEIYRKFSSQNMKDKVVKVDVFIINDKQVDGMFCPGAIILHEETVKQLQKDYRCFYLIARAMLGLLRLSNNQNVLTLDEILALNHQVFQQFENLRNYMHIQNIQYFHIRSLINDHNLSEYLTKNQSHFLQYYSKELRYVLKEPVGDRISFELGIILVSMKKQSPQEFWENLLSNYNFLNPLIIESLVKVGLKKVGVPLNNEKLLELLRVCLQDSKYVLNFYTDKEISDNLPKFISCEAMGLESRLPKLRVLQKFKNFITQKYINYLPGKSNTAEAEAFYNQFKKFNQKKNFHHLRTLKNQAERVCSFGDLFIRPERIAVDCSLPGWKLLRTLKLYPADPQRYNFLKVVDFVSQV